MNDFDPELRRLIRLARTAQPAPLPAIPSGLANRIVHAWRQPTTIDMFAVWQLAVWRSAWVALAVIVLGLAVLTVQKLDTDSPYDVSPAIQVVSANFVP